jgi:hypothetical protein
VIQMKNSILLLVVIVADVLCLSSCEKTPKEYFPLTEGMTYKFEVVSKGTDMYAQDWFEWENLPGRDLNGKRVVPRRVTVANGHSSLIFYSEERDGIFNVAVQGVNDPEPHLVSPPICLLRTPLRAGQSWQTAMQLHNNETALQTRSTIEMTDEVVSVPAGTFKNCLRVRSVGSNENRDIEKVTWYAPNVGIIKFMQKDKPHTTSLPVAEVATQLQSYKPR